MKKILFIALVATVTLAVSCTNDSEALTPTEGIHEIQNNAAFASKVDDTLHLDTGGQGGDLPPKRP